MTLSMVVEHLSMVVFAIVIAILIGVPLGLLCYLSRAARGVVLRVVDLIQTTPALALLAFLLGGLIDLLQKHVVPKGLRKGGGDA